MGQNIACNSYVTLLSLMVVGGSDKKSTNKGLHKGMGSRVFNNNIAIIDPPVKIMTNPFIALREVSS